ncbi:MAG TPA: adenosylcobinamide-GDP ribazoletransferase [Steroidobacteraceae bacterium]|nr:adenosylcobinamide-GDP ribazoletransferase [Steroidobacteraceae bacterium]
MSLRGLRLATQFLTRVPVPSVDHFSAEELSRSAAWFPLIGLAMGLCLGAILFICSRWSMPVAAALALLAWVWLTGALHLDGLADLTDALAAAHRDPQRFFAVLSDPHIGTFGVVSVVLALMLKLVGLMQLSGTALLALALIPAWSRLGPLAWSRWLTPLKPGHGERFAWHLHAGWIAFWSLALLAASAAIAPVLLIAPIVIAAWGAWLHRRLGGTTGDCLGAGVEITEVVLLIALSLAGGARLSLGALWPPGP